MAPPHDAGGVCCIVNATNKREADGRDRATVLTAKFSLPSRSIKPGNVRRNILRRTRGVLRDAAVLCLQVWAPSCCSEEEGGFHISFTRCLGLCGP